MDTTSTPVIRRYGPGEVPNLLDTLVEVWADAHADHRDVAEADLTPATLHHQLTSHARHPGFVLAAAYDAGILVGFGYAFPCTPLYWFGTELLPAIPEPARSTDRLMGLCELAVRPGWQDRGIGSRLHQTLIDAIGPHYASLLAMPGNTDSQRLYRRLGYTYAGPYRNAPGGAVFDLLLLGPLTAEMVGTQADSNQFLGEPHHPAP